MKRYRSNKIEVDVCDVIDAIDDDVLLDECHSRGLTPAEPGETVDIEIVREAYDALQRGAICEARSILDRLLFPKWQSVEKCESEYKKML